MEKSIQEVVHETAKGLYDIGLMDVQTMRDFDSMCLPKVRALSPREIKALRLQFKLSQPVFAEYINVSSSTVKKWETGEKNPSGPALKLLNLIADWGLVIFQVPAPRPA